MWSIPDANWDGFRPVEYTLDADKVLTLPLSSPEGSMDAAVTSIGAVLELVRDHEIQRAESSFELDGGFRVASVITNRGQTAWRGSDFACRLLATILDLRRSGANAFEASWFWFDSDSAAKDPHDLHSFFVIHDGKIVLERSRFSDSHGSGFDPTVWVTAGDSRSTWFSDNGIRDARIRYFYRQFYRETVEGQLMVLRSDEPELFHYPEGRLLQLLYASSKPDDDNETSLARKLLASLLLDK